MTKELSKKIILLNYFCMFLIVMLHSLIKIEPTHPLNDVYLYIRTLGDSAVPTFFTISSFLFFYSKKKWNDKIKSRFKSLILPYLIWSLFFTCTYVILNKIGFVSNTVNDNFDYSVLGIIKSIITCTFVPQFWYIRVLFFIIIISTVYELLLNNKKMKWFSLSIPIIIVILNLFIGCESSSNIRTWIGLFLFIGWMCKYFEKNILDYSIKKTNSIVYLLLLIIFPIFVSKFDVYSRIYYIWRMLSPLLVINVIKITWIQIEEKIIRNNSFYIFALHYFIISIVRNGMFLFLEFNTYNICFVYIISVLSAYFIPIIIAKFIKKYFNKLYLITSGNRG